MPGRSSSDALRAALRRLCSSGLLLLLLLLLRRLFAKSIWLMQILRPPARRTRQSSTCTGSHRAVLLQKLPTL